MVRNTKAVPVNAAAPVTKPAPDVKAQELIKLFKQEGIKPAEGLKIKKRQRYYEFPNLEIKNVWSAEKKSAIVRRGIIEILLPNYSLDSKKNRIGLRLVKSTEQFDPNFKTEEVTVMKLEARKPEDKLQEATAGMEAYIDYIEAEGRKTKKVKIIGAKEKDILFNMDGKLYFGKSNNLFSTDLKMVEKKKKVGQITPKLYRFIGIDLNLGEMSKIKTAALALEGDTNPDTFMVKASFAVTHVNGKLIKSNKEKPETNFEAYTPVDETLKYVLPGRIIIKITPDKLKFYALLEKEMKDNGETVKSFSLYEMFRMSKEKEKKEDEVAARIAAAFEDTPETPTL